MSWLRCGDLVPVKNLPSSLNRLGGGAGLARSDQVPPRQPHRRHPQQDEPITENKPAKNDQELFRLLVQLNPLSPHLEVAPSTAEVQGVDSIDLLARTPSPL